MLEKLRRFLKNPKPSREEALGVLRAAFLGMFLAQVAVAAALGGVLSAFAPEAKRPTPLLLPTLISLAVLLLPLALGMARFALGPGGKRSALYATILSGVLLSSPAWFAAFALTAGEPPTTLLILLAILTSYYAIGLLLTGGFANVALQAEKPR